MQIVLKSWNWCLDEERCLHLKYYRNGWLLPKYFFRKCVVFLQFGNVHPLPPQLIQNVQKVVNQDSSATIYNLMPGFLPSLDLQLFNPSQRYALGNPKSPHELASYSSSTVSKMKNYKTIVPSKWKLPDTTEILRIPLLVEFLASLFSFPFSWYHDSPRVEDWIWLTRLFTSNKEVL